MPAALVVLSGGQDSTICLKWAQNRFGPVDAITFDYGQRHRVEIDAAREIVRRAGVRHHKILAVDSLRQLGGNALTGSEPVREGVSIVNNLPNTFVPGRNLLFLTLAAAWAYQLGTVNLVTGVCQTDYSGYPDCRAETMTALQQAIRLGMETSATIHTPLMHLTKADSVRMARDEGALELLAWSHTCYNGAVPPCGNCPACRLRAKGFAEARIPDPLVERLRG